ncbi:hypothetical protein Y032_0077g1115 [Ancylostoma ceylanicum]|uniref:Uncharacterized protein n=1 Tax=Ancylostoma ceylanicum TaxID=53326 RepID=A0A016TTA3_9BILA|nr:hypothetical protein Y032_0077g1115 [Ancylostoma ceylanicum]
MKQNISNCGKGYQQTVLLRKAQVSDDFPLLIEKTSERKACLWATCPFAKNVSRQAACKYQNLFIRCSLYQQWKIVTGGLTAVLLYKTAYRESGPRLKMFCFVFRLLLAFALLGAVLAFRDPCKLCTPPPNGCCGPLHSQCCYFKKKKRDVEPIDFKPLDDVEPIDFKPLEE